MAVDIGVQHTDGQPARGHRGSEIDCDTGLSDATLTRGHRIHAGERTRLGEWDDGLGGVAAQLLAQIRALFIGHYIEIHRHHADAGDVGHRLGDSLGDFGAQRTARRCQIYLDMDIAIGTDRDALHHAQFGDRFADLRVVDLCEGSPHIRFRYHWHGTNFTLCQIRGRSSGFGAMPEA